MIKINSLGIANIYFDIKNAKTGNRKFLSPVRMREEEIFVAMLKDPKVMPKDINTAGNATLVIGSKIPCNVVGKGIKK